jgi:hypothetical protein
VASTLGEAGANIVEVFHQRVFSDLPAKRRCSRSSSRRATATT